MKDYGYCTSEKPMTIMEQIQAKKKEQLCTKYLSIKSKLSDLILKEWSEQKTIEVGIDNDILTDIKQWLRSQGITYGELNLNKRDDKYTRLILSGW